MHVAQVLDGKCIKSHFVDYEDLVATGASQAQIHWVFRSVITITHPKAKLNMADVPRAFISDISVSEQMRYVDESELVRGRQLEDLVGAFFI